MNFEICEECVVHGPEQYMEERFDNFVMNLHWSGEEELLSALESDYASWKTLKS